jgi:hypothetical protein
MRIAFDVNGVLRNTLGKAEQVYQKFFIDDYVKEENENEFEYSLNLPVTSMNLIEHFKFPKQEDLYDFFYVDFPMNIFGHAASISANTFNQLNEIYEELRDKNDILIISDEIQKSKPATLFFLSKYGCLIEKIFFYSKFTINDMLSNVDCIVTANPELLNIKDKVIVKYETDYNKNIECKYVINSIDDFKNLYKELNLSKND